MADSRVDPILVTGATGFIGRHLTAALRAKGLIVIARGSADGDISCAPINEVVGHVFHLAGKTFVPESWEAPFNFYAVNVLGTVNVLDLCRRTGASATLVSSYVYATPQWLPITEDHPVQAWNPYSHTKIMAEDAARFYCEQFGTKSCVVRPFNIYGPGQARHFLIPSLIAQALDHTQAEICVADDGPKRDYLHVNDLVALLATTYEQRALGTYNAGSGTSVSIAELVTIINHAAGTNKPLRSEGRRRAHEVMDVVADSSKVEKELGWRPRISLQEGIAELVHEIRLTGAST